jgi:protein involved in polysaccharide export with SLBB domain
VSNYSNMNTLARWVQSHCSRLNRLLLAGTALFALLLFVGCKSPEISSAELADARAAQAHSGQATDPLLLREGDTVRLTFPGAPNLNAVQAIRRDGKLALALVGEVQAAGLTPADLEKKLLELYGPQLQTKELTVTLESSAFPVYVTGAVLKPGKVVSDHPLTALEAISEAGGFDMNKADLKRIRVIRNDGTKTEYFSLNLKAYIAGKNTYIFHLKPSDILFVPERFVWF